MIKVGDRVPSATVYKMGANGPEAVKTDEYFKGRKVVLFGLPGAYTPTCSAKHVPGFVQHSDQIKGKGIDEIACISVNDAFVMGAWGKEQGADGKVTMLADGSAELAKKMGLEFDLTGRGMGVRMQRFSAVIDDGVVKSINIEEPGGFNVSSAENTLKYI